MNMYADKLLVDPVDGYVVVPARDGLSGVGIYTEDGKLEYFCLNEHGLDDIYSESVCQRVAEIARKQLEET